MLAFQLVSTYQLLIALADQLTSAPNGIRTRAAALKGRCPGPLDDGGSRDGQGQGLLPVRRREFSRSSLV